MLSRTRYDELLEVREKEEASQAKDEAYLNFDYLHDLREKLSSKRKQVMDKAIDYMAGEKWQEEIDDIDSEEQFQSFIDRMMSVRLGTKKRSGFFVSTRMLVNVLLVLAFLTLGYLAYSGNLPFNSGDTNHATTNDTTGVVPASGPTEPSASGE